MNRLIQEAINPILGKRCCRKRVWSWRSLSLGFGKQVPHGNARLVDEFYGEWEIRTYTSAWRVIRNGIILCGSKDKGDSAQELRQLQRAINQIKLGRVTSIRELSGFDIRVELEDGLAVDFLAATSREEESCVYIVCPGNVCVTFTVGVGWEIGSYDKTQTKNE